MSNAQTQMSKMNLDKQIIKILKTEHNLSSKRWYLTSQGKGFETVIKMIYVWKLIHEMQHAVCNRLNVLKCWRLLRCILGCILTAESYFNVHIVLCTVTGHCLLPVAVTTCMVNNHMHNPLNRKRDVGEKPAL